MGAPARPHMAGPRALAAAQLAHRARYAILAFWATAALVALPVARRLIRDTGVEFRPPVDSPAAEANRRLAEFFPVQANLSNLVVLAQSGSGVVVTHDASLRVYSFRLNETLHEKYPEVVAGFQSCYALQRDGVPATFCTGLLPRNPDGSPVESPTSTLFIIAVRGGVTSTAVSDFSDALRGDMERLADEADLAANGSTAVLTGLPALYSASMDAAIHDVETMDEIVLPFAMGILVLLVRSCCLLIIPLAALGVAASLSFATVDLVTTHWTPVLTVAPPLMASVFVACSIDYSMFLLTRFQLEKVAAATLEVEDGDESRNPESTGRLVYRGADLSERMIPVVASVLETSGKIIVASGGTLVTCFIGLLALPLALMHSMGLSCAIALCYTMVVNLTMFPALIFSFPAFFSNSCMLLAGSCAGSVAAARSATVLPDDSNWGDEAGEATNSGEAPYHELVDSDAISDDGGMSRALRRTWWFRVALCTQTWCGSLLVLTAVAAATIPLGLGAFDGKLTANPNAMLSRGSEGLVALEEIERDFSAGTSYPYRLMIEAEKVPGALDPFPDGTTVVDKPFVAAVQRFLAHATSETDPLRGGFPKGTQVESYLWVAGAGVPHLAIYWALHGMPPPMGPFFRGLVKDFTNADRSAALVEVTIGGDPFGERGRDWIQHFRKRIEPGSNYSMGLKMSIAGFAGDVTDSMHAVHAAWPLMAAIVTGVVLVIMAGSFGSVLIAVRGVVTIAATVVTVTALAKLAYCDGALAPLGDFAGFGEDAGGADRGLVWLVQPTVFPLLVGIALDYDIFLVGRIHELHDAGMSTRDSILYGVASTGTTITAAGLIQALAFFGLMLSSTMLLNQLSFFLLVAVLFDTFVVRTLVVPSIMFLLAEANWWPGDGCCRCGRRKMGP